MQTLKLKNYYISSKPLNAVKHLSHYLMVFYHLLVLIWQKPQLKKQIEPGVYEEIVENHINHHWSL